MRRKRSVACGRDLVSDLHAPNRRGQHRRHVVAAGAGLRPSPPAGGGAGYRRDRRRGRRQDGSSAPRTASAPDETVAENAPETPKHFGRKCLDALRYGCIDLVGSIGGWVAGLVVAALITVYVPADLFSAPRQPAPYGVMLAVLLIAVPMYVCATGSIPIALSLVLKRALARHGLRAADGGPGREFRLFRPNFT